MFNNLIYFLNNEINLKINSNREREVDETREQVVNHIHTNNCGL